MMPTVRDKENRIGKSILRNKVVGARPRDDDHGSDNDDRDPTTLASATSDALCERFFIAAAIGLTVDDGV